MVLLNDFQLIGPIVSTVVSLLVAGGGFWAYVRNNTLEKGKFDTDYNNLKQTISDLKSKVQEHEKTGNENSLKHQEIDRNFKETRDSLQELKLELRDTANKVSDHKEKITSLTVSMKGAVHGGHLLELAQSIKQLEVELGAVKKNIVVLINQSSMGQHEKDALISHMNL